MSINDKKGKFRPLSEGLATETTLQAVLAATGGGGGGIPANKATDAYGYQAKSLTATHKYYFYEDGAGAWYVLRNEIATGIVSYAKGTGGYASVYVDATSAPSSGTFASYDATFDNVGAGSLAFDVAGNLKTAVVDVHGHEANIQAISDAMDGAEYGLVTNAVIHGKTTAGGGGWVDVKVNPSGSMQIGGTIDEVSVSKPFLINENGVESQMLGDTYFNGAPVVMDSVHHEIHCGDMVSLYRVVDLGNGANSDLLFITPNNAASGKRYHFDINISAESEFDYKLYEEPTASNNGTALSAYNRNRQDPAVAEDDVLFFHTPTITVNGTLIDQDHQGAGRATGGVVRGSNEWVLKNNAKYWLRVNNATTTANHISIKINYYVHPGV